MTLALALLLAATPVPQKLALPQLSGVQVSTELLEFSTERLATALRAQGFTVVTQREITTILGLERQKQLLGCATDGCSAELAGALGVDATAMGSIAKLDGAFELQVKIVSAADGHLISEAHTTASSERDVLRKLDDLAADVKGRAAPGGARAWAWVPLVAGSAVLLGAGGFFLDASAAHTTLTTATLSAAQGEGLVTRGERSQWVARVGLGVGVAALLTSGALFLFGAPPDAMPAVGLGPDGATIGLSGHF